MRKLVKENQINDSNFSIDHLRRVGNPQLLRRARQTRKEPIIVQNSITKSCQQSRYEK